MTRRSAPAGQGLAPAGQGLVLPGGYTRLV